MYRIHPQEVVGALCQHRCSKGLKLSMTNRKSVVFLILSYECVTEVDPKAVLLRRP